MKEIFLSCDTAGKRLSVQRMDDGAILLSVHSENNAREFIVSGEEAAVLAGAILQPSIPVGIVAKPPIRPRKWL